MTKLKTAARRILGEALAYEKVSMEALSELEAALTLTEVEEIEKEKEE